MDMDDIARRKYLCPTCMKLVDISIVQSKEEREIKGKKYPYTSFHAYCKECGKEVDVNELYLLSERNSSLEYRRQNNLIMMDEIEKVMSIFDIEKRPLSLVLGFGELTITRYLAGQIPSAKCSAILKGVLNDYRVYRQLLDENKKLIADGAYRKTMAALRRVIRINKAESKIEAAALYIINSSYEVTNMSLQKLLYYANAFYMVLHEGIALFPDDCQAWIYGPVYPQIYSKYKEFDNSTLNGCDMNPEYMNMLNEEEKNLLNAVISSFAVYNGSVLADFTHAEEPWIKAREGYAEQEAGHVIISKDDLKTFFSQITEQNKIDNQQQIEKYAKKCIENYSRRKTKFGQ